TVQPACLRLVLTPDVLRLPLRHSSPGRTPPACRTLSAIPPGLPLLAPTLFELLALLGPHSIPLRLSALLPVESGIIPCTSGRRNSVPAVPGAALAAGQLYQLHRGDWGAHRPHEHLLHEPR